MYKKRSKKTLKNVKKRDKNKKGKKRFFYICGTDLVMHLWSNCIIAGNISFIYDMRLRLITEYSLLS